MRFFSIFLLIICVSTADVIADDTIEKTYSRGLGLLENGYYNNAAKHFTDVIIKGESAYLVSAYLNRAQANKDAKKYDLALRDTEYLQSLGNYPEPYHLDAFRAELFMRMGNTEKSLGLFKNAISQIKEDRPESEFLKYMLRFAYVITLIQDFRLEKAEQQIKVSLKTRLPDNANEAFDPFIYTLLTVVQILKGEYVLAMQSADEARISPQQLMIYPLGAVAANKLGKYGEAINIIEEYISQKPLSNEQSAFFKQLKKKLWKVEKYPDVDRVTLPQENASSLIKFLQYRLVARHKVDIKERNTKTETSLDVKMKIDHQG